jgi:hypothetical protein
LVIEEPMKHGFAVAAALAVAGALFRAPPANAFDACLGAKIVACLDGVRPYISALDYQMSRQELDRFLAGDIAGKRKPKSVISVIYHSRFSHPGDPNQTLTLDFAASLVTTGVEISLRPRVEDAETEEDYGAIHMYEAALFALGSRKGCRELATPHDFYLFFHTQVRPRLKNQKTERTVGVFKPPSEFFAETGWIGICGSQMSYRVYSAEWGAVQDDMDRKYHAASVSLAFR